MKIYTRGGDDGTTALADGTRVSKAAPRVSAYGEVDELNASIGVLRAERLGERADDALGQVQAALFEIGAFLARPRGGPALSNVILAPAWIESWIDSMEAELPPLKNFVLPAGSRAAALAHQSRTICRRAERGVVALAGQGAGADLVLPFLNRLSDALFVLARWLNQRDEVTEVVWRGRN